MIKVNNLDKTYFKGKTNELHVIDNTSITLPSTGLICFLGQSGSGKTTLLNTIAGLDKADKGTVIYDDLSLDKYRMSKIDSYRNQNIGYIFQNYLLFENESVYDNLRIQLDILGITNKEEIDKRIKYVLTSVGLYKFRKKLAGSLSGGQQQRVSIARALLKNAKLIIADEPTGNLDSENTIEVMNILKKISEHTLVLVVTHNKEMASFYSSRIIEISDGKIIKDYENVSTGVFRQENDRVIYLQDLVQEKVTSDHANIKLYFGENEMLKDITLVIRNNTIYIDSQSKIQVIAESNMELKDEHYEQLTVNAVNDNDYDTSWYNNNSIKNVFLDFWNQVKLSFKSFFSQRKRTKFFNFIFFLIGGFLACTAILQVNFSYVDSETIVKEDDIYTLHETNQSYSELEDIDLKVLQYSVDYSYIDYVYSDSYVSQVRFQIGFNSVVTKKIDFSLCLFSTNMIDKLPFLAGKSPTNTVDIVLGKRAADYLIKMIDRDYSYEDLIGLKYLGNANQRICGVTSKDSFACYGLFVAALGDGWHYLGADASILSQTGSVYKLIDGKDISANNEILVSNFNKAYVASRTLPYDVQVGGKTYTVVGVFASDSYHTIDDYYYTSCRIITRDRDLLKYNVQLNDTEEFIELNPEILDYFYYANPSIVKYELVAGTEINQARQCLASIYSGAKIGEIIEGYEVVGIYEPSIPLNANLSGASYRRILVISNQAFNQIKLYWLSNTYRVKFQINPLYKDEFERFLSSKGYSLEKIFDVEYNIALQDSKNGKTIYPYISLALLAISIIYIYFSFRSKMISEIYDLGVKRSLGKKKISIIKEYLVDILVKTSLTSLLGYLITWVVYAIVAANINHLANTNLLLNNTWIMLLGIVIIFISSVIVGLIPIVSLLRKTPSEINSKYDI